MKGGTFQSPNFVAGASGWQINANGDVEFNVGNFRGGIANNIAATGEAIDASTTPQAVCYDSAFAGVYLADANNLGRTEFIGFVANKQNLASGDMAKVTIGGVISGFSGLTAGDDVYLSDTAGAISNTPGTYQIAVGKAIATDKIILYQGASRFAVGSSDSSWAAGAGTQSAALTTVIGFRARMVEVIGEVDDGAITRVLMNLESSAGQVLAPAIWANGVYRGWNKNGSTSAIEDVTDCLLSTDNNTGEDFKITVSPSHRSIIFNLAKTGTDAQTFYYKFMWKVWG